MLLWRVIIHQLPSFLPVLFFDAPCCLILCWNYLFVWCRFSGYKVANIWKDTKLDVAVINRVQLRRDEHWKIHPSDADCSLGDAPTRPMMFPDSGHAPSPATVTHWQNHQEQELEKPSDDAPSQQPPHNVWWVSHQILQHSHSPWKRTLLWIRRQARESPGEDQPMQRKEGEKPLLELPVTIWYLVSITFDV